MIKSGVLLLSSIYLTKMIKNPRFFSFLPISLLGQSSRQLSLFMLYSVLSNLSKLSQNSSSLGLLRLFIELYAFRRTFLFSLMLQNHRSDYAKAFKAAGYSDEVCKKIGENEFLNDFKSLLMPFKSLQGVESIKYIPYTASFEEYKESQDKGNKIRRERTLKQNFLRYLIKSQQTLSVYIARENIEKIRSQERLKVVFFVHGGGWSVGCSDQIFPFLIDIMNSTEAYIFISIDYRLYPKATVVDMLQDVNKSLLWSQENLSNVLEDKFGGEFPKSSEFVLMGGSAGGHLAVTVSLQRFKPVNIKGCVNLYGVVDFTDDYGFMGRKDRGRFRMYVEKGLLKRKLDEKNEAKEETSPMAMLRYSKIDKVPPIFTAHGTNDMLVPIDMADVLHDELKKRRLAKEEDEQDVLVRVKGGRHAFEIIQSPMGDAFSKANLNFIKHCFSRL